jgi:hypothetical protein
MVHRRREGQLGHKRHDRHARRVHRALVKDAAEQPLDRLMSLLLVSRRGRPDHRRKIISGTIRVRQPLPGHTIQP